MRTRAADAASRGAELVVFPEATMCSFARPRTDAAEPFDGPWASGVRQIAAEYQLNPITVSRAYQELADEELVEKRRGLGMYVTEGAREKLLASERERFLKEEWPAVVERIERLGLSIDKLVSAIHREAK